MLRLRKVEITGFKSFCERTAVTFSGSGITCIVGPNGCGKSNVVDAVSWVLGEQSHKSLRAERMADCIFNGTTKRPPMGLAEVTLTMEDPELAEAARFVMEGAARDESAEVTENTEILADDPAQTPEESHAPEADEEWRLPDRVGINAAAATNEVEKGAAEPGGKFKRKKKSADTPPSLRGRERSW